MNKLSFCSTNERKKNYNLNESSSEKYVCKATNYIGSDKRII